jgi:hypothetical protein
MSDHFFYPYRWPISFLWFILQAIWGGGRDSSVLAFDICSPFSPHFYNLSPFLQPRTAMRSFKACFCNGSAAVGLRILIYCVSGLFYCLLKSVFLITGFAITLWRISPTAFCSFISELLLLLFIFCCWRCCLCWRHICVKSVQLKDLTVNLILVKDLNLCQETRPVQ